MRNMRTLFVCISTLLFLIVVLPVSAACMGGTGTNSNDKLNCTGANNINGNHIKGLNGNDTIITGSGLSTLQIMGDNSTKSGNDSIVVNGTITHVSGDRATTNQGAGNDTIVINGTVTRKNSSDKAYVRGDWHTIEGINGGDDVITLNAGARVDNGSIQGDMVIGAKGGDDTIRIEKGAKVIGTVFGDGVNFEPGESGDDLIVIGGKVVTTAGHKDDFGHVAGDVIFIGDGGNDTIIVQTSGQVVNTISGDSANASSFPNRIGGNDTIIIRGIVGDPQNQYPSTISAVRGDDVHSKGGHDLIIIEKTGWTNYVLGDTAWYQGGRDTIEIYGHVTDQVRGDSNRGDGGNDKIIIKPGGYVGNSVAGDHITAGNNLKVPNVPGSWNLPGGNGGDDTIFIHGRVKSSVFGDRANKNGGNDEIVIGSGGNVTNTIYGDYVDKNGGNDHITIRGIANKNVYGDSSDMDGGNDTIIIESTGNVKQIVAGDVVNKNAYSGGNDRIEIYGVVNSVVTGDHVSISGKAGRDTIIVYKGGSTGLIDGDRASGPGGNDSIVVAGRVNGSIHGDNVTGSGGNDTVQINGAGLVIGSISGDLSTGNGGHDKIIVKGEVRGNVYGDSFKSGSGSPKGGNDTITVEAGGKVTKNIFGDNGPGRGGNDRIIVRGRVEGSIYGDKVNGLGGLDYIRIEKGAVVVGNVFGDGAGTPANQKTRGADDTIIVNGVVKGNVNFDGSVGGYDLVVVAGHITGNLASEADYGNDGDDLVVIQNTGVIDGYIDPGSHINGDMLLFNLETKFKNEFDKLSDLFDGLGAEAGTVTYRGNTYTWRNVEILDYVIQLLQSRFVPLYCSGIYEKNDDGTACVQKGQEEVDAIMFHRNNPGYDGRLPGTETCAIYNYGNAMRVYEVMDGNEGELVVTIGADLFERQVEANTLLASSASGQVNVYYLTSNEVQIECTDTATGKTQVRIIPDFSGTVNASFDKTA